MTRFFLNIGSSRKKLPGFINVDLDPVADLCADMTRTLPFAANSVGGIFSEHFVEHISQAEGAAFLRECRRVLVPGGLLRIATPDLDYIVERFSNGWREQSWLTEFGYEWIANRCEMFNTSMREWGHKWIYNEEELTRLAGYAGLAFKARPAMGESDEPAFRGLEYRQDSKLILEFTKPRCDDPDQVLVSILIPAYNAKYFRACLDSALSQTYTNLEIIIGDDCPTDAVGQIVAEYADSRIKYHRNSPPLGAYQNYLYCFSLASGDYIKFLNDDDTLHPDCVERMATCLRQNPEVTLVTSHRQRIDAAGNFLPDTPATRRPVNQDSLIDGVSLASGLIGTFVNFVGEPTTVMFRRRDIVDNRPHLLSFADRAVAWNVDVAMWLTLLGKGDAIYLADTLSYFRSHGEQEQVRPDAEHNGTQAWHQVRFDGQRLGFLGPREPRRLLARPLVSQPDSTWPAEVVTLLQEADAHFAAGDFNAARNSLSEALDFAPDDAQLIIALGNVLLKLGQAEAARREFVKATSLYPGNAQAHSSLAVALLQLDDSDGAIQSLRCALSLNPSDLAVLKLLGTLCLNNERCSEGVQAYEVSIIIPTFNNLDLTRQCLDKIRENTDGVSYEIIVVDNGSNDGTPAYLLEQEEQGQVRAILNAKNEGFAHACNQGLRGARGRYVLLLNNDTAPTPNWLRAMINEMETGPDVGVVGACLLYPDSGLIQHAGVTVGVWEGLIRPYHKYRLRPLAHTPEAWESQDCQVVTGACMLIRREVLAKVPALDEAYHNGFEDVDFCFRARQAGFRVRYCAESTLYHHESVSKGRHDHDHGNFLRLIERWNSIIRPEESERDTELWWLDTAAREGYLKDPADPRYAEYLFQFARSRGDAVEATDWQARLNQTPTANLAVSIIIPVFNKVELTRQCLAGIAQQANGVQYEIIVVDNASSDDTPEFLGRQPVRIISNQENAGFARACNQGGQAARGNYLLFLNNDTVPTPGWLEALLAAAHKPEVGVVGAKLLYPDGRIQHAGIGFVNGVPDHPNRFAPADAPEVNQYRELDMVTGACQMMPKGLFLKLGGFDESYRNGVEDIDLCLRARLAGFKVVYEPKAVLYHHEGQSAGRFDHVQENLQLFAARWRSRFDSHGRLILPGSPTVLTAERSALLKPPETPGVSETFGVSKTPVAVRWEGSQFVHHSLALINREVCIQLAQTKDVALSIIPFEQHQFGVESDSRFKLIADHLAQPLPGVADVHVRHQWPPDFTPPAEGHWVMIQPWEFGSIPKAWIEAMRDQVDEVWAYTSFVRESYIRSGLPAERIQVVPPGVNTALFKPDAKPLKLKTKKRYKFLFVGGTIWRKGPDVLLDAYLKAFTADDDVCLVIKDMGGSSFYKGMTFAEQIRKIQADPLAPEILYLTDDMPPRNLPRLYAACDCLVHPYRGEGFGLPIAEAMACGLPVIVTGAGASLDFCDEETAYLIPARKQYLPEKRIGEWETVDLPFMFEPDREATARLMRQAFEKPHLARAVGARASKHIRQKFSWERSVERVLERLRALRGAPVLRQSKSVETNEIETAFIKGNIAVAAGRWEEAGAVFEALARKHPQLASAQAAFASTLLVRGEFGRALPLFKRAVDLSPDDPALRNQLGVALFQSGDSTSAEAAFQNVLARDPQNVDALLNMVEVYRTQKRYPEAAQQVKRAVQTAPKDPNVLAAFGALGLELGDSEAAQIALVNLREVAPEHPAARILQEAMATA